MVISNLLEIEDLNIRFVSDQETVKETLKAMYGDRV